MITLPKQTILDAGALASAEAAHHFASVLAASYRTFWQRNDETVLAELNADAAKTLALFQLNTQAGTSVNAILDSLNDDRLTNRAPTSMPPYWGYNGQQFTHDPPTPDEQ
jgi:hypothetical protein